MSTEQAVIIGDAPKPSFCETCNLTILFDHWADDHRARGHHVLSTHEGFISHIRRLLDQNAAIYTQWLEARAEIRKIDEELDALKEKYE